MTLKIKRPVKEADHQETDLVEFSPPYLHSLNGSKKFKNLFYKDNTKDDF